MSRRLRSTRKPSTWSSAGSRNSPRARPRSSSPTTPGAPASRTGSSSSTAAGSWSRGRSTRYSKPADCSLICTHLLKTVDQLAAVSPGDALPPWGAAGAVSAAAAPMVLTDAAGLEVAVIDACSSHVPCVQAIARHRASPPEVRWCDSGQRFSARRAWEACSLSGVRR